MSLFHRHQWQEQERFVIEPLGGTIRDTIMLPEDLWERAMYGFTTILLVCQGCGDKKSVMALGKASK